MGNFKLGKQLINYGEVYEEMNKKRLEDKHLDDALNDLLRKESHEIKTISNSNKIRQKQSMQKVINLFKR